MPDNKQKLIGHLRIEQKRKIYENPWLVLEDYSFTNTVNNLPQQYGIVRFKNRAAGIIPIDNEGMTYIVGQHRVPENKYSWELPEGGVDDTMQVLDGAKKELLEETKIKAKNWHLLAQMALSNSVSDEMGYCYVAWGFSPLRLPEGEFTTDDPSELMTIKRIKICHLHQLITNCEIWDGFSHQIYFHFLSQYKDGKFIDELNELIAKTLD